MQHAFCGVLRNGLSYSVSVGQTFTILSKILAPVKIKNKEHLLHRITSKVDFTNIQHTGDPRYSRTSFSANSLMHIGQNNKNDIVPLIYGRFVF